MPAKKIYPWSRWLRPGSSHVLRKGEHFTGMTHAMISYLYGQATANGVRLRITNVKEGVIKIECYQGRNGKVKSKRKAG
jgi:hypothetical protein